MFTTRLITHQHVDGVEGHGDGADEDVGDGQRRDEEVGRLPDLSVDDETHQHLKSRFINFNSNA